VAAFRADNRSHTGLADHAIFELSKIVVPHWSEQTGVIEGKSIARLRCVPQWLAQRVRVLQGRTGTLSINGSILIIEPLETVPILKVPNRTSLPVRVGSW